MKLDILAIAVHPDDVELGCSGTLMMEKKSGKKVGVLDLTKGELGTRGTPELREREALTSARVMELDVRENASMADGFFRNDEDHQRAVIRYLRKYQPDIVLTNALDDRHPDHGRAGHMVSVACFLSGLRKIETRDENGDAQQHWRPKYVFHMIQDRYYEPTFVYDISPVIDRKIESIKAFSSQFFSTEYESGEPQTYISTPEFLNSIIGRHAMFGKMIGVPYAEGFISEKMIGINSFHSFIQKDT